MEVVIFGSFFGLSATALSLNHMAKRTEQQRQSVSNANFIKFQRSFFMVYFLALLGDWLQGELSIFYCTFCLNTFLMQLLFVSGPYVYKLYNFYGYQEHQIATLYVAGFASSVIIGTATGPLADKLGRRRVAQLFCVMYT